ncbi:O-antigen ligase family protein [Acinetobacter wanghuae]|uniref:O-antigen ligase family protein n=1 Tax=Acinetobacter wanghuae TaxID=2662362 RepID=UPI003AF91F95
MILKFEKSILLLFLLMIFIASGFKNDLVDLGSTMSVNWESFEVPSIVNFLKEKSSFLLGFSFLIFLYSIFKIKKIRVDKNYFILFYFILFSFAILRLFFGYFELSLKAVISILILSSIYIMFSIYKNKYNLNIGELFLKTFYIFGFIFFLVNYYIYFSGMGYVYGFNRFFGSTAHPNFLGVQSAICFCLMSYYLFKGNYFIKFLSLLILFGFLYLVFLSGSRTALVFIFIYMYVSSLFFFRYKTLFILISTIFFSFVYFIIDKFVFFLSSDVYDRGAGGSNTRSDAWLIMLNAIYERPFIGYGLFNGASENSYFRLAANYGIFYAFFYILLLIFALFSLVKKIKIKQDVNSRLMNCIFFGVFISLVTCGMLEGYLSDYFSIQMVVYFILLYLAGEKFNYVK